VCVAVHVAEYGRVAVSVAVFVAVCCAVHLDPRHNSILGRFGRRHLCRALDRCVLQCVLQCMWPCVLQCVWQCVLQCEMHRCSVAVCVVVLCAEHLDPRHNNVLGGFGRRHLCRSLDRFQDAIVRRICHADKVLTTNSQKSAIQSCEIAN